MQPEQNQNYWQPSADTPTEMPATDPAEVVQTPVEPETQSDITSPITWQASEFVHHEKSSTWFLVLLGVTAVLLLIDVFLVRSWTFGILIVVMALTVMVFARRPPRTITYSLSGEGIQIDEKHFSFHEFRAFGVVQENAFYSIRLVPNKRFMPMVSVYFPTEHGEQIVDMFGSVLPMEHIELDPIDKLVEKIRF